MSRSELDTDTSIISDTHDFIKTSQKLLFSKSDSEYFEEKSIQENTIRHYPLPTEESFEDFLKKVKLEQYSKTQYSIPYLLSLKKKYTEKPDNLKEIKIPLKYEIRSRAKILTDEAFRDTRNYLNLDSEILNNSNNLKSLCLPKQAENCRESFSLIKKTKEIREVLNKISFDNFDTCKTAILKINFDQFLIENFRDLIFSKLVNEKLYFELYYNMTAEMFKIYSKKTFPQNPEMNFKSLLLKKCQEEFYNLDNTTLKSNFFYQKLSRSEEKQNINRIKIGNINLIAELYLNNFIQIKIIQECVDYLIKNLDDDKVIYLTELTKKIFGRLEFDDLNTLNKIITTLESYLEKDTNGYRNRKNYYKNQFDETTYNKKTRRLNNKTKYAIQSILEMRNHENDLCNRELVRDFESEKATFVIRSASGKTEFQESEYTIIEKDLNDTNEKNDKNNKSINEPIEDLSEKPSILEKLLNTLGTEIDLYKSFRLTEDLSGYIKDSFMNTISYFTRDYLRDYCEIQFCFNRILHECQSEEFIIIGSLIESFFMSNSHFFYDIVDTIFILYYNGWINSEAIRHGVVYGFVAMRDNIIDYPICKRNFIHFIYKIYESDIIDDNLYELYLSCLECI